jgi:hypothetical protein
MDLDIGGDELAFGPAWPRAFRDTAQGIFAHPHLPAGPILLSAEHKSGAAGAPPVVGEKKALASFFVAL